MVEWWVLVGASVLWFVIGAALGLHAAEDMNPEDAPLEVIDALEIVLGWARSYRGCKSCRSEQVSFNHAGYATDPVEGTSAHMVASCSECGYDHHFATGAFEFAGVSAFIAFERMRAMDDLQEFESYDTAILDTDSES